MNSDLKALKALMTDVAATRKQVDALKELLASANEELARTPEKQECERFEGLIVLAKQTLSEVESAAKQAIIAAYLEDGNKKPVPGAGIRVSKGKVVIRDAAKALEWAEVNMPIAVVKVVDAPTVISWGESQVELPDWLERNEDTITPTLASNLSEYLE